MVKYSLNLGAMTGALLIVIKLIAFMMGMDRSGMFEALGYLALVAGLVYGIKGYRDGLLGGYISYEKSLGLGTLISVGAAIVFAFFLYIYFNFVDASAIDVLIEEAKEELYKSEDLTDEQLDTSIEALPAFISPGFLSFFSFLIYVFTGFIFSLIVSIFLKKKVPYTE